MLTQTRDAGHGKQNMVLSSSCRHKTGVITETVWPVITGTHTTLSSHSNTLNTSSHLTQSPAPDTSR